MLGLAKRIKAKIFQASTSEAYGEPHVHPQPVSYWGHVNPLGPRACYDEGKRAAVTLFFDYHRQHGVRIKVERCRIPYSPVRALECRTEPSVAANRQMLSPCCREYPQDEKPPERTLITIAVIDRIRPQMGPGRHYGPA